MAEFTEQDLSDSRFQRVDLSRSRFERVDLTGAQFRSVDLRDVDLRDIAMNKVRIRGAELVDVEISGELGRVIVNGVEIGPLVNAELDRRYPDRAKMRPTTADGFREAWDTVERLWAGTVERARGFEPEQLHASVDGEWSFIETLRHLAFATDCWVRRAIQGDPAPWHPLGLPWGEAPDTPGFPHDRSAKPSLDEALAVRLDRMATVRRFVDELTDESLDVQTEPVEAPGWPPPNSFPVRECLLVVLNEEWEHRLYAERDLTALARQDS